MILIFSKSVVTPKNRTVCPSQINGGNNSLNFIHHNKIIIMKYLILLIFSFFSSVMYGQFTKGKYVNIYNNCRTTSFLDSNKVLYTVRCKESDDLEEDLLIDLDNGTIRDMKKEPYLYMDVVDYWPKTKEYIVNFNFSDGVIYSRESIINKGYFLVVTGLKSKKEIMNHYTISSVYVLEDSLYNFKTPNYPNQIIVVDSSLVDINSSLLIAYGQTVTSDTNNNNDTIYITDNCCVKTTKQVNPEIFAYRNYKVLLKSGNNLKQIPVIYDFDEFNKIYKSNKDIYLAHIYRFNPLRKDVVNKSFNEIIKGQVLILKVFTINGYKKRYNFLFDK